MDNAAVEVLKLLYMRGTMQNAQPSITDIERQIRFELKCIEDGARSAREMLAEQGLVGSKVGSKMMQRVIRPLIAEIKTAHIEAHTGMTKGGRERATVWWAPFLTLEAEKLAVIVLNVVFSATPRTGSVNFRLATLAAEISRAAQIQIDYDAWVWEQTQQKKEIKQRLKEEKESGIERELTDTDFTDLDRLLQSTKQVDLKAWRRFNEKITRTKLDKWSREHGVIFGVKCIDLLLAAKPDWYSVKTNPIGRGMYETQLILSEEARATLFDLIEREEMATPRLLPTIIPPAPWRYVNQKEPHEPAAENPS